MESLKMYIKKNNIRKEIFYCVIYFNFIVNIFFIISFLYENR